MNKDKRFIVDLSEDVATGDLVSPIPIEILNELSWYEGIELEWVVEGDELILREYLPWVISMKISTIYTLMVYV